MGEPYIALALALVGLACILLPELVRMAISAAGIFALIVIQVPIRMTLSELNTE